jgi:hypothetical protein
MPKDADLISRIEEWLSDIWSDPAAAAEFAESPATSLASHNLSQSDLSSANLRQAAGNVGSNGNVSAEVRSHAQNFSHSHSSGHHPVQEVAVVTKEIHHDRPQVTNVFNDNSTHFDQSQTLINNGIIEDSEIEFDNHSANAIGDGSAAASGGSNVNNASGDGAVANQGGTVNQALGRDSQIISESEVGQNVSNSDGAVAVDGNNTAPVNTGVNTGVLADGGVQDTVVGDDNRTANVDGSADGSGLSFGSGDVDNASNNNVQDGAVSGGGDAGNVSDNTASEGSAIAGDDAKGRNTDVDTESNDTTVVASENVNTSQDGSDADAGQEFAKTEVEVDDSNVDDVTVDA